MIVEDSILVEAIARAICVTRGDYCEMVHICDRIPVCKCFYWRQHSDEARAALFAIRFILDEQNHD